MLGAVALLATWGVGIAQDAKPEPAALVGADWKLERITLDNGRTLAGLVQSEGPAGIEFIEVRRAPGKPMSLVVWPIERQRIAKWERLPAEDQKTLRERLETHKRRTLVEGRRMEDLELDAASDAGRVVWDYQGDNFTLRSTADEAMTRRLIVRLEQIFTGYRQLLPARSAADRVEIRVFGSTEEYRAALSQSGLKLNNPAVYLADRNVILAGSEVNRFHAELDAVSRRHGEIRRQLDALVAQAPARVKQLGEDLKNNNVPAADQVRILLAEQRKWTDQRRAIEKEIAVIDRKNQARFNEVTARMFTRLGHEAFHAYLETSVYPRASYDVPRWLNEGLAQIFEAGLLEADSLRIDAPNLVALEQLQGDLRGSAPLALAELLGSGSEAFLGVHDTGGKSIPRAYYYSWGLAYYLAFEARVLGTPALDAYLSPAAKDLAPVERFEKLVGMPLPQFESRWRKAMLALDAGR